MQIPEYENYHETKSHSTPDFPYNEEIYYALLDMTKDLAAKKESEAGKKKVYYISAEFLIGKLLSNNLINLGLYKTVKEELEAVRNKSPYVFAGPKLNPLIVQTRSVVGAFDPGIIMIG